MKTTPVYLFIVSIVFLSSPALAELELPLVFSNGAVLQRGQPIPVWGWASPGEKVSVSLGNEHAQAVADADGNWQVELGRRPAGGPFRITVRGSRELLQVWDVYIGDVWVCSGQSNMEWTLANSFRVESTLAETQNYPMIRQFKVPLTWAESPQKQLQGGEWEVFSAETGNNFTAVGLFFAMELYKHTGVPIGLMNSSWGGSRIEPWIRADVLGMQSSSLDHILAERKAEREAMLRRIEARLGKLPRVDMGIQGGNAVWADPNLDDSSWEEIPVPGLWEAFGYEGFDGTAWYRTSFDLSADDLDKPLTLNLAMIDDSDEVWVNGSRVGGLENSYNAPRIYLVDKGLLKAGDNSLVVRVVDTGGGGGIYGDPASLFYEVGKEARPFVELWKFRVGAVAEGEIKVLTGMNQIPTVLYNAMIAPIQKFPIKGAIWYQGESNASHEDAFRYRDLFKDLITSWRNQWGQGDFPFLWVQLANFISGSDSPAMSPWAVLRESQSAALDLPATGQAVIIDIGAPHDIHPRNKHDVGYRLALAARHIAYGQTGFSYSGPVYRSHVIRDGHVVLSFDHADGGLLSSNGGTSLLGFEIAGSGGTFHPAEAVVQGDKVIVSAPGVSKPAQVRYAWSANPDSADLINGEGLPASPFRTTD